MSKKHGIIVIVLLAGIAIFSFYSINNGGLDENRSNQRLCCRENWAIKFQKSYRFMGIYDEIILFYDFSSDTMIGVNMSSGDFSYVTKIALLDNLPNTYYFRVLGLEKTLILAQCTQQGLFELIDLNTSKELVLDARCSNASILSYTLNDSIIVILSSNSTVKYYVIGGDAHNGITVLHSKSFKANDIIPFDIYMYNSQYYILYVKTDTITEENQVSKFYINLRIIKDNKQKDLFITESQMPTGLGFIQSNDSPPLIYLITSTPQNSKLIIYDTVGDKTRIVCNTTINSTMAYPLIKTAKNRILIYTVNSPLTNEITVRLIEISSCNNQSTTS